MNFVDDMSHVQMPVRFLQELARSHYFIAGAWSGASRVYPLIDMMLFDDEALASMSLAAIKPTNAHSGVDVAYHESTHAWLDLMRETSEVETLRREGIVHYAHAAVASGAAPEPQRLFEEAMGSYVGHRAATFWNARVTLLQGRTLLANKRSMRHHALIYNLKAVKDVPFDYDVRMRQRTFGYQSKLRKQGSGDDQDETLEPMTSAMKSFADERLLERKIPDHFLDAGELTRLWDELVEEHQELLRW